MKNWYQNGRYRNGDWCHNRIDTVIIELNHVPDPALEAEMQMLAVHLHDLMSWVAIADVEF